MNNTSMQLGEHWSEVTRDEMSVRTKLVQLFHTVRYLKLKQIYYRMYYSLRSCTPLTIAALSRVRSETKSLPVKRFWSHDWFEPAIFDSGLIDDTHIEFLGVRVELANADDWNNPQYTKLWLYHLHYFNILNSRDAEGHGGLLNELIQRWIDENPPRESIGWEPYPSSLRIVNWIKWFSMGHDPASPLPIAWLDSLYLQAHVLSKQIEYHILANHLLANAKALIFAGAYFQGERPERWLRRGLFILDHELKEQFLSDGGHFELSPMYHALLLWDLCDLVQLAQRTQLESLKNREATWKEQIIKGLTWLDAMTHPDGDISFFNDASFGMAPKQSDLQSYAAQLGIQYKSLCHDSTTKASLNVHWLKESGYVVVRAEDKHQLICDVAKIGPNYQPGHAHADTLSFELSLYGQRVIVNSGISEYGTGPLRQAQRGTKAHSTVCIDQANSSEVWAGFRVARRAVPQHVAIQSMDQNEIIIIGAHDGYRRLSGKNVHRRTWQFSDRKLRIYDEVEGGFGQAEARFYLHPTMRQIQLNHAIMTSILADGQLLQMQIDDADALWLESTSWYPGFGQAICNQCLVVRFKTNILTTQITW